MAINGWRFSFWRINDTNVPGNDSFQKSQKYFYKVLHFPLRQAAVRGSLFFSIDTF